MTTKSQYSNRWGSLDLFSWSVVGSFKCKWLGRNEIIDYFCTSWIRAELLFRETRATGIRDERRRGTAIRRVLSKTLRKRNDTENREKKRKKNKTKWRILEEERKEVKGDHQTIEQELCKRNLKNQEEKLDKENKQNEIKTRERSIAEETVWTIPKRWTLDSW